MNEFLAMALRALFLCGWIVYLQHRNKRLEQALHGAMLAMIDVADGVAVVEKTKAGINIRKIKNDTETR